MVLLSDFSSSKCSLFHNSNVFGSCIIHILYAGCAKIRKKNFGAKRLSIIWLETWHVLESVRDVIDSIICISAFWIPSTVLLDSDKK